MPTATRRAVTRFQTTYFKIKLSKMGQMLVSASHRKTSPKGNAKNQQRFLPPLFPPVSSSPQTVTASGVGPEQGFADRRSTVRLAGTKRDRHERSDVPCIPTVEEEPEELHRSENR